MINFGTIINRKFKVKSTNSHWLLKLFYNDGTKFVGLSDSTRVIAGVTYYGLATWGTYHQEADLINMSASQGTFSVAINNSDKGILNQRFSDLMGTRRFDGRRWELNIESSNFRSSETVGQGIISSDITSDENTVNIRLLHKMYNRAIPIATVTDTNAPIDNIGAPVPYAYGITLPTRSDTTVGLDRRTLRGLFPAIISNKATIRALPDVKELGSLNTRHVAIREAGNYAFCLPANTTVDSSANPSIIITGTDFRIPLKLKNIFDPLFLSTDRDNAVDENISTIAVFRSQADGNDAEYFIEIDPIKGDGDINDIYISINNQAFTAPAPGSKAIITYSVDQTTYDGNSGDLLFTGVSTDIDLGIGASNKEYPTRNAIIKLTMSGDTLDEEQSDMTTKEITAEIRITPKDTFVQKRLFSQYTIPGIKERSFYFEIGGKKYAGSSGVPTGGATLQYTWSGTPDEIIRKRWKINAPSNLEYIYYAGEGRQFGSWISDGGRSNGYVSGVTIKNPVYMAESLIIDEAGYTDVVDEDAFDLSGNISSGAISKVFDRSVSNILFAFSQPQFTTLFSELNAIGSQIGTTFWVSGSGKIKSKTRLRSEDYTSADLVVLYSDITPGQSFKTSLGDVKNSIFTGYKPDYSTDLLTEVTAEASDATSQGDTVDGYGEVLIFEDSAPYILDSGTATGLNTYTLNVRKQQKRIIVFTSASPRYQALEICDTVSFKGWNPNFKVLGLEVAEDDIFMIQAIDKQGADFVRIVCLEVS